MAGVEQKVTLENEYPGRYTNHPNKKRLFRPRIAQESAGYVGRAVLEKIKKWRCLSLMKLIVELANEHK